MNIHQKIAHEGRRHYDDANAIVRFNTPEQWADACMSILRAFAEEEPTEAMKMAGSQSVTGHARHSACNAIYRAMMAEKLKELEKPHEG